MNHEQIITALSKASTYTQVTDLVILHDRTKPTYRQAAELFEAARDARVRIRTMNESSLDHFLSEIKDRYRPRAR